MTVSHVFPRARDLKRAALAVDKHVVTYNSKSSHPWEIWYVAGCGVSVFTLSVHKYRKLAEREYLRLNNPAAAGATAADIPMQAAA